MNHSRLFLVQVWRQGPGVRASVLGVGGVGDDPVRWFDDEVALSACLVEPIEEAPTRSAVALSSRESEVALLFAAGSDHKRIALRLGLAPATVRNHLSACYRKLGVANRGALFAALVTPRERRAAVVHLHHGAGPRGATDLPAMTAPSATGP